MSSAKRPTGTSLFEVLFAIAILATVTALAMPFLLASRDDIRMDAAARYMSAQIMLARAHAARHGAAVGLRFERSGKTYRMAMFLDGNGNGVRQADMRRGADPRLTPWWTLADLFPGVQVELGPGIPAVGSTQPTGAGADAVRFGRSDTITLTPIGTATSGTIYLRGPSGRQYAIRVLGTTARMRVLLFDAASGTWRAN